MSTTPDASQDGTPEKDNIKKTPIERIEEGIKDTQEMLVKDSDGAIPKNDLELLQDGIIQKMNEHKYRAVDQHEQYLFAKKAWNDELGFWYTLNSEEQLRTFEILNDSLPAGVGKHIKEEWHKKYDGAATHLTNMLSQDRQIRQSVDNYQYHIKRIKELKKFLSGETTQSPAVAV